MSIIAATVNFYGTVSLLHWPSKILIPYSKKLTRNDFNAKVINAEEINAVKELLLYFFNKINAVSTSGFQII